MRRRPTREPLLPGRDMRRRPTREPLLPGRDMRRRPTREPLLPGRDMRRRPTREPLLPGRGVAWISAVALVSVALLDLLLTGRLSQFFDLSFVLVCVVAALAVRSRDTFTVAVLPPLIMGSLLTGTAMLWPSALTSEEVGLAGAVLTGLAHHAAALVAGHGSSLAVLAARGTLTGEQRSGRR
jgi:hypothetical protein